MGLAVHDLSMRLFVGVPVPCDLGPVTADLPEGRPVPAGTWHVTLRFLGDMPDAAPVADALAGALGGASAVPARVAGVGAFQSPARARIAWAGVEADLGDVHARVQAATRAMGRAPDERAFVPHVTLARLRHARDLRSWVERHRDDVFWEGTLDRVVLYESVLGPQGPRYIESAAFPLATAAADRA